MSYTQYSVCLAELMRGCGIDTPTHGYNPEQAFADGKKLLDRITELEAAKKDAERYREALDFVLKVFEPCKADCIFSKRLALPKARTTIDAAIQAEGKA